jgi:hypothetical protein
MPTLLLLSALLGSSAIAQDRISTDGFKGVRIGMTVTEASKAYGSSLKSAYPLLEEASCFYIFPSGIVGDVGFMVVDGHVARVDVSGPGYLTVLGVGVGSSEAEVKDAYSGRVKVSPHPYMVLDGHYMTVDAPDGRAMIFETERSKVTSFRAGRAAQVRWIEGCS